MCFYRVNPFITPCSWVIVWFVADPIFYRPSSEQVKPSCRRRAEKVKGKFDFLKKWKWAYLQRKTLWKGGGLSILLLYGVSRCAAVKRRRWSSLSGSTCSSRPAQREYLLLHLFCFSVIQTLITLSDWVESKCTPLPLSTPLTSSIFFSL